MGTEESLPLSRDITLPTKVRLVKAMVFPVVMYGCKSWTVKKAECRRIDAFELWCWRRLLRVPWSARRSNQSILKEISPGYSLEGQESDTTEWLNWTELKVRNKTRVPTLTTTIQHSFRSVGHRNQNRKRNKRNPYWKKRSKTLTVCRWHDPLHRKP